MADLKGPTGEKTTKIEEGTEFNGSLTSSCPVVVHGRFKGDVTAPSLTVGSSGVVDGRMTIEELRSTGELAGEFDTETAHVSGTVKHNTIVRAKSFDVKLTPTEGKIQLTFGKPGTPIPDAAKKKR